MRDQIANHVKSSRRYRHPKGGSIRPNPRKEQRGVNQKVLPAPFRTRRDRAYLVEKIKKMQSGGATADRGRPTTTPSLGAGLGFPEGCREDMWVEVPASPFRRNNFPG